MRTILVCAAALSISAWESAAMADSFSYTGNWQVELTHNVEVSNTGYHRRGPNTTHCVALTDDGTVGWTHCVALTDDGTVGWPHSGEVLLDKQSYGEFQVIGRNLVIFVQVVGSGEEVASWTFSSTVRNGNIDANGAFDYIQGGESYASANATFATRGSC
jgi:hypothetical protein